MAKKLVTYRKPSIRRTPGKKPVSVKGSFVRSTTKPRKKK
jgi:hypothetical protein